MYVPVNIFQSCQDGSSSVESVLNNDYIVLLNDTTQWLRQRYIASEYNKGRIHRYGA